MLKIAYKRLKIITRSLNKILELVWWAYLTLRERDIGPTLTIKCAVGIVIKIWRRLIWICWFLATFVYASIWITKPCFQIGFLSTNEHIRNTVILLTMGIFWTNFITAIYIFAFPQKTDLFLRTLHLSAYIGTNPI